MLTKILVKIIVVLILINVAMILTVFAVSPPDTNITTAATEYAQENCQTEHSLATETPSVVLLEFEQEHESENTIPFTCEGTIPNDENETFQCIDDNLVTYSELPQLPESKIFVEEPAEELTDDSEEVEITDPSTCYDLTYEEKDMLLRIAMAEVGGEDCVECLALVMKTVLNRMESPLFPSTIYRVIHAENQFSPVASGSFSTAVPNEKCYEALELVINGWDESQGALYFEACVGSSWHSRNLELLFQHCSTRFYR